MSRRSLRPSDVRHFMTTIIAALILLVAGAHDLHAQAPVGRTLAEIQFNSGQSVQPIFDGWTKNPDGSYELHFGYLNRNYVEHVHAPLGPDNMVEPGGPDRGQPTFFYPRFNHRMFSVTVPRDFGTKREIVWTLKTHGATLRAVAWLQPEWEIELYPGAARPGADSKNVPPTITVDPPSSPVRLADRLALT